MLARAVAMQEELGFRVDALAIRSHIGGWIEELAGDLDAAAEQHELAIRELERIGDKGYLSMSAAQLANVRCAQRRYDEAEELAGLAEHAAAADDVSSHAVLRNARARVLASRGRFEEAERAARDAIALQEETDFLNQQGDSYLALAEVLRVAGRLAEARVAVEFAVRRYEQKENVVAAARARELLACGDGHR